MIFGEGFVALERLANHTFGLERWTLAVTDEEMGATYRRVCRVTGTIASKLVAYTGCGTTARDAMRDCAMAIEIGDHDPVEEDEASSADTLPPAGPPTEPTLAVEEYPAGTWSAASVHDPDSEGPIRGVGGQGSDP